MKLDSNGYYSLVADTFRSMNTKKKSVETKRSKMQILETI